MKDNYYRNEIGELLQYSKEYLNELLDIVIDNFTDLLCSTIEYFMPYGYNQKHFKHFKTRLNEYIEIISTRHKRYKPTHKLSRNEKPNNYKLGIGISWQEVDGVWKLVGRYDEEVWKYL